MTKTEIESQEKPCSAETSDVQKECRLVIERLELEIQLATLCRRRCRTELTIQVEELETLEQNVKIFPRMWTNWACSWTKRKAPGSKVARKVQKEKPKYMLFQKVWLKTRKLMTESEPDSGELGNNSAKTGKRKERHESSMKKCSEKWKRHRSECGNRKRICARSSENTMYLHVKREIGRPNNLSAKNWQMMQSNNTKI